MVQAPVTLVAIFAVKRRCNLPRRPSDWSGTGLVPDLTVADLNWIAPIVWTILVNIQIPLGAAEMYFKTRPVGTHLLNGERLNGLSLLTILDIGVHRVSML